MTKIPFVTEFEFEYERCEQVAPGIRRIIARNPGPFTFTGTGVYIIGTGDVALIDPGPALPEHRAAIEAALAANNERISHIFVTHHHLDHTPLAHPLAQHYGCKVYGFGAQKFAPVEDDARLEAGDDLGFQPDVIIEDEQIFDGGNWRIQALHTPGHTSNHVCYAFLDQNALFCGDHVMGWSTSVVSRPDGDMGDYLAQLRRIRDLNFKTLYPTHGTAIEDPHEFVTAYIDHRVDRENQIIQQLSHGPQSIMDIVKTLYTHIDKRLYPAAAHSVLSHLVHLVETGRASCDGVPGLRSVFSAVVEEV
jgi:glyoxylase-like metal-dependent hydrolase (beta-lactamase superfamily II)